MADRRPSYLVGAPGPERSQVQDALRDLPVEVFDTVPDLFSAPDREPGFVYLVGPGLDPVAVLDAVTRMARGRGEWTPVLVRGEGGSWVARTLALGYPHAMEEAARGTSLGPSGILLELRGTLSEISRARHDINNPLTSALAETQLLMLDHPSGEIADSLRTILEQLRRIRDLVAATGHLRPLE